MEKENLILEVKPEISTKEIENELIEKKVVSEEQVENSLNYEKLSEAEKTAIDEFISKVDVNDTAVILSYGASAQQEIAKFSDDVLQNVRTKNTGDVGELLTDLVVEIKDFDTHKLFIAEVTDDKIISNVPSVTYKYYFENIKPAVKPVQKKVGWVCKICGYVYEGKDIPSDFVCPICKHSVEDFEEL